MVSEKIHKMSRAPQNKSAPALLSRPFVIQSSQDSSTMQVESTKAKTEISRKPTDALLYKQNVLSKITAYAPGITDLPPSQHLLAQAKIKIF